MNPFFTILIILSLAFSSSLFAQDEEQKKLALEEINALRIENGRLQDELNDNDRFTERSIGTGLLMLGLLSYSSPKYRKLLVSSGHTSVATGGYVLVKSFYNQLTREEAMEVTSQIDDFVISLELDVVDLSVGTEAYDALNELDTNRAMTLEEKKFLYIKIVRNCRDAGDSDLDLEDIDWQALLDGHVTEKNIAFAKELIELYRKAI